MRSGGWILASILFLAAAHARAEEPPWTTNPPIVEVKKEIYLTHNTPGEAPFARMHIVGPAGERLEIRGVEDRDDTPRETLARLGQSRGGPWDFFYLGRTVLQNYAGVEFWEDGGAKIYDPAAGKVLEVWLRQVQRDGRFYNFTYAHTSLTGGRNWEEGLVQLKYEAGPDFDPAKPLDPAFLEKNNAYFGNNIILLPDGTMLTVVGHANALGDPQNNARAWRMGSVVFLGRWNLATKTREWQPAARVEISPEKSSRGLMEPEAALLKDGRILIVWRGSDTPQTPGRKWFSLSTDGGMHLSPPAEWKYDDGTEFYSPSSYHRMLRHTVTGKLYWFGNICPAPPTANSPRYPLVIAEVDEEKAAIKKGTVTVIDDRKPDQPEGIQFSNFSIVEDPASHEIEMWMTLYGERTDNPRSADCYYYTIKLKCAAGAT